MAGFGEKWFGWMKNWLGSKEKSKTQTPTEKTQQTETDKKNITVQQLRRLITKEFPPFTWEKVGLFLYKEFKKHGLTFTQLQGNEELPKELIDKINETLDIFYKKKLDL